MRKPVAIVCICTAIVVPGIPICCADTGLAARANGGATAGGAYAARSSAAVYGERAAAAGYRGAISDGQGNRSAVSGGAYTTRYGAYGARGGTVNRTADGSVTANGRATASGDLGTASGSGSYDRSADGTASATRNTTISNANTGVTLNGSASYVKSSGVTRTAACTDATGATVACYSRLPINTTKITMHFKAMHRTRQCSVRSREANRLLPLMAVALINGAHAQSYAASASAMTPVFYPAHGQSSRQQDKDQYQ